MQFYRLKPVYIFYKRDCRRSITLKDTSANLSQELDNENMVKFYQNREWLIAQAKFLIHSATVVGS